MPQFSLLAPASTAGVSVGDLVGDGVALASGSPSTLVTSITLASAEVHPGALFAALPGRHVHGADSAADALARGAVAILTDPAGAARLESQDVPVLIATDPRAVLGSVSARVYRTHDSPLGLLGVTGTNGKTSTVHLLDAILEQVGVRAGHSSTADRRSGGTTVASRLTSPEAPELHALLARMREDHVEVAALEVSAQALSRGRVDGLVFDVAGFTNLSHDHLDDYGSMEAYLEAKLALFQPDRARSGVVSLDSPAGVVISERAGIPVTTISSEPGRESHWSVRVTGASSTSTTFTLSGPDGRSLRTTVPLVGRHMAADAGLAIAMLDSSGIPFARLAAALEDGIRVTVPGRTELLSGPAGPLFYSDFSHTPDSIEKTLAALRAVTDGRLLVILGADGDKDPSKRGPMGRAAADGADIVVVTDHHPRFEDPDRIRRALVEGARATGHERVLEIAEPAAAVREAVGLASQGDTILWVGPGDTDYRVVRGQDLPYSPRADARRALAEAGWPTAS